MEINKLYGSFFRFGDISRPYADEAEYTAELLTFLDMCLVPVLSAKGVSKKSFPDRAQCGVIMSLSVSPGDIEDTALSSSDEFGTEGLTEEALEEIENAYYHIEARRRRSAKTGFSSRFDSLCIRFGLNDFERFAMLLAYSAACDRKYEAVYCSLHNNSSDQNPTKWLAVRLFRFLFGRNDGTGRLMGGTSPLCLFLCDPDIKRRERGEAAERLILSRRACAYILGSDDIDPELSDTCRRAEYDILAYIPVRDEQFRMIGDIFAKKGIGQSSFFALNIYGAQGIGRRYSAFIAARSAGMELICADLYKAVTYGKTELTRYLNMVYAESVMRKAAVCFVIDRRLTEDNGEGGVAESPAAGKIRRAAGIIARIFNFCFWITREKDDPFTGIGADSMSVELPMLTGNERRRLWEANLPPSILDDSVKLPIFANQYILTPGSITAAARTALDTAAVTGKKITGDMITQSVRQHSSEQFGTYATRINAVFTWDDLVVGDEQKRRMKMICDHVRYGSVVNEDWGFGKKTPYGRGLCALFYGSPGTGKTMAVQVMANELGIDLYRIDLSQLSSKYIGETQKNIAELFRRAANINAMLFFDEADSMFAKRSEVKDANDRYANADTAFLLQKLEDYEGITILATNFINNIDDAFKRRIKFMVNFAFPSAEVRLELWKKILPASAKIDEQPDFEFFAERFELSGSNIKEILTNAAFLAASEGCGIRNIHIIEAVKLNFSKYGKVLNNDDFGYLGQ